MNLWKNALLNEPAYLIGNGPSAGDVDYALLRDRFTIGINRAFYLLDPTVLFFMDGDFIKREGHRLDSLQAVKVCRDLVDMQGRFNHFSLACGDAFQVPESAGKLHGVGSSGPIAFQLACVLGCNPIYLIGYDCCYRGKQTDFYGENPSHHPNTLPRCLDGLRWIASLSSPTVINCSDSPLLGPRTILGGLEHADRGKGRQFYLNRLNQSGEGLFKVGHFPN